MTLPPSSVGGWARGKVLLFILAELALRCIVTVPSREFGSIIVLVEWAI